MAAVTVFSVIAGLAGVVGGFSPLFFAPSRRRVEQLTALSAGVLMGAALISMLPHAFRHGGGAPFAVLVGYLLLFAIRALAAGQGHSGDGRPGAESVWAVAAGFYTHSFVDGGALGVAVHAGGQLGWVALLAMFLHKLPEGFGLSALVLAGTGSRRAAAVSAALLGLSTVAGAWSALLWARAAALPHGFLAGLAAGSFLYVGATDMMPVQVRRRQAAWLVPVGAALVYVLTAAGGGGLHGP